MTNNTTPNDNLIPKEPFRIKTFNLGCIELPTREEIYDERARQTLSLDSDDEKDEFYFPTFNMSGGELPTRSELYDEACDRHLRFNK